MIRALWVAVLVLLPLASWASDGWMEDFEAAKKLAAASGKMVVVDVTGSDWCPPCQQIEAEVFSRPEFLTATAPYVRVRLDYPRYGVQGEKIRVQNAQLADRYPFDGFPTVLMLDAQGLLVGQHTGYVPGGVPAFLDLLKTFEAQKAVLVGLTDALKKSPAGETKARAQDALFRQAEAWNLTSQYADLPLKIVQEDRDNKAGLKGRYQVYNTYNRLLATWAQATDFRKAAVDFQTLATKALPWPELHQRILLTEGMVWWNAVGDEGQAKVALSQARVLGPTTPWGMRAAELLDQLP